ncbi:hypothetical protein V6N13_017669 [Hibiscus sabdariffa]|uniref:Uncharacterized protein n=2 Tax=Hibiscus sabdariffa TaxID=183260 RepID=A0ABR2CI90_9ROSI
MSSSSSSTERPRNLQMELYCKVSRPTCMPRTVSDILWVNHLTHGCKLEALVIQNKAPGLSQQTYYLGMAEVSMGVFLA